MRARVSIAGRSSVTEFTPAFPRKRGSWCNHPGAPAERTFPAPLQGRGAWRARAERRTSSQGCDGRLPNQALQRPKA